MNGRAGEGIGFRRWRVEWSSGGSTAYQRSAPPSSGPLGCVSRRRLSVGTGTSLTAWDRPDLNSIFLPLLLMIMSISSLRTGLCHISPHAHHQVFAFVCPLYRQILNICFGQFASLTTYLLNHPSCSSRNANRRGQTVPMEKASSEPCPGQAVPPQHAADDIAMSSLRALITKDSSSTLIRPCVTSTEPRQRYRDTRVPAELLG